MTSPELVFIAALIILVLAAVSGVYDHYLNRAKARQMSDLIADLHQVLMIHVEVTGFCPPGRSDAAGDTALAAMQKVPAPAARLQAVNSNLLYLSDGKLRCLDPWGQSLRYLTARSKRPEHQRRVQANGDMPIFESAGPDRDFGDTDSARQADNICSDDPS